MNLSIKNIEKLLIEANEKSHENSKCIDCKKDSNVYGGRWIKQSEIPSLDEIGQPVYMDEERVLLYPLSHNLIIGSTGSGKTTVLYDNCIDFYSKMKEEKRPSFLVLDLKGDMYTRHTKKLEEAGYKVRVIDMRNAFFSARYNPLATIFDYYSECCQIEKAIKNQSIGDTYKGVKYDSVVQANSIALARYFELNDAIARSVNELAEIIVVNTDAKNLNWTEGGRSCLKAILYTMLRDYENKKFGMTKEKFTLSNVIKTSFTTENDYIPLINWLRRADDIPIVAGALGSCYDIRAQVTRDGYTSSLNTELNKYSLTSVSALTSQSDILISEIAECKEDYAIFLITDSRAQITNNIAMMFINDLINTLSESADKKPARCLDKDFIILADEMGNLPQIPNMSGKISTLRSRKIWLQMSVQSLEQLDQTYGDKVAATILDNCDTHMFLGCNNDISKERFAKSMGENEGLTMSANIDNSGVAQMSVHTANIPVVRKSDLGELKLGEFYVRSRVCANLQSSMIPFFRRTDVDRSEKPYELQYNGFDPEKNVYYIKETNALEGIPSDEKYTSKKKPIKTSIAENFSKIIAKNNTGEIIDLDCDNEIEYKTEIEKNTPPKTYMTRAYSEPNTMAEQIYLDMKKKINDENKIQECISDIITLDLLPTKIQRALDDGKYEKYAKEEKKERWIPFFRYEVLFDANLKPKDGKEKVINKLERKIKYLTAMNCFSEEIMDAYQNVLDCIKSMSKIEYAKYCQKAISQY